MLLTEENEILKNGFFRQSSNQSTEVRLTQSREKELIDKNDFQED